MTGAELVAEVRHRGGTIRATLDDRVQLDGPRAALRDLLDPLHRQRAAVVRALRTEDPRPDLTADANLWPDVLATAYDLDADEPYGLYGALLGLRSCGARLEATDRAAWTADCHRWLDPHLPALRRLLAHEPAPT